MPKKPQKPGVIFKGWSESQEEEWFWDFSRSEVMRAMPLYVVFATVLTVTYDVDKVLETKEASLTKSLNIEISEGTEDRTNNVFLKTKLIDRRQRFDVDKTTYHY